MSEDGSGRTDVRVGDECHELMNSNICKFFLSECDGDSASHLSVTQAPGLGLLQNKKRSNVFLDKILTGVKDSSNIRCSIWGCFSCI